MAIRNVESNFSELPQVDIQRSVLDLSHGHKTSFNCGQLIPFFWTEILPGDTFSVNTSIVARLQTLLTPIMDNVYLDYYFFFDRFANVWTHWNNFLGENDSNAWVTQPDYSVPYVKYPSGGWNSGTIADYLGVPVGVELDNTNESNWCPNALPFRVYAHICDQWFRDQNITDPLNIPVGDSAQTGTNGTSYVNDVANGGAPFIAAKFHDYYTSCLPAPQKGDPATVAFASINNYFPVGAMSDTHDPLTSPSVPMRFGKVSGTMPSGTKILGLSSVSGTSDVTTNVATGATGLSASVDLTPNNLWAKVSYSSSVTVNELRLAFQLQKLLEKNARAGTRIRELIREHFGTIVPDGRMQIPEYLGGARVPLSIHQVTNTSQSSAADLGDLGGMSNTADSRDSFVKSFTEAGILMGVCVVRYDHTYCQGLSKMFTRRSKYDYYWPVFANLGEVAVKKGEIMLYSGAGETPPSVGNNDKVFGYQEYGAEYRYMPSRVSGELRPGIVNSLATWHLADNYNSVPSLSDAWIREDKSNVDRVLAVTSSTANQVLCDFWLDIKATRPMPVHSIPGLIDHH